MDSSLGLDELICVLSSHLHVECFRLPGEWGSVAAVGLQDNARALRSKCVPCIVTVKVWRRKSE